MVINDVVWGAFPHRLALVFGLVSGRWPFSFAQGLDILEILYHNTGVEVTKVELKTPEGDQGFLEANKEILEHLAVKTLLDVMGSNASPEIKLAAADKALTAIGKQKPAVLPAQHTTNIQIAAIAPHIGKALTGLGRALELAAPSNAPQMKAAELVEDEDA